MANYTTINKSSLHMNTKLYTGNNTSQAITGVGFQPDWTWIKSRTNTEQNNLFDAVRGSTKRLISDDTSAEWDSATNLTSFDSDGFTTSSSDGINDNSVNYASWNWKANGAGSSNSDGSVTSTVSVNTTAGFSIVKFNVGSSGGDITVGHGLGVVPKMIIIKSRDDTYNWDVYHENVGNSKRLRLNTTDTQSNSTFMSNTSPTSSVFTFKQTHYGTNSNAIAYCFNEIVGYSKFNTYNGNGNADGPMIYTGFKPSFIIIKKTSATDHWVLMDNKRQGYNFDNELLLPSDNRAEEDGASYGVDILSNGFKCRTTDGWTNASGQSYIYMAFGQTIVGTNNVPATAR